MSERRDNFKKWLDGGIGYTLKNDDINYIMSFVDELFNINDKLSSALNSAEQRIDKAIEYIESATIVQSSSVHFRNTLFKILQGKEME